MNASGFRGDGEFNRASLARVPGIHPPAWFGGLPDRLGVFDGPAGFQAGLNVVVRRDFLSLAPFLMEPPSETPAGLEMVAQANHRSAEITLVDQNG